jgi:hypothetical protein
VITLVHGKFDVPDWHRVTIKRVDDKPFWIEEKGQYMLATHSG